MSGSHPARDTHDAYKRAEGTSIALCADLKAQAAARMTPKQREAKAVIAAREGAGSGLSVWLRLLRKAFGAQPSCTLQSRFLVCFIFDSSCDAFNFLFRLAGSSGFYIASGRIGIPRVHRV
jgi:hypothetical protein